MSYRVWKKHTHIHTYTLYKTRRKRSPIVCYEGNILHQPRTTTTTTTVLILQSIPGISIRRLLSPLRRTVRSPSRTAGSHRTVHIKSTLTTTHLALFTLKVHLSPKPDHSFAWSKSTHFPYLFASNHSQSIKTKLNQNTYGLVSTHDLNRHTQLVIDRNEVLLLFYDWLFIYRLHTAAPWTIPSGISTTYYCLVAVTADAQTGSTIRYTKTRGAQVFPLMTSWVTYWPKFDQRIFLKSPPSLGILGLHWAT